MLCCGRLALAPCYCPGGDWAHGGTPTHTHDQALWDPPWAVAIAGLGKWPQPGRVWQALGGWGRAPPHAKRAFDGTEVVHGIGHPLGVIPTNAHGCTPQCRGGHAPLDTQGNHKHPPCNLSPTTPHRFCVASWQKRRMPHGFGELKHFSPLCHGWRIHRCELDPK